jgi:glycine C-acetyltransferase
LVASGSKAFEIVDQANDLRDQLRANTHKLRHGLQTAGFTLKPGPTPILPVMIGDATRAGQLAEKLLAHGIYVIAFSYPVVPQGQARIRVQVSAAHTSEQIDRAIHAFTQVGRELGLIA